jgi:enoyl-CoA hydratase/carnithine racemase
LLESRAVGEVARVRGLTSRDGAVLSITLNRPEVFNAFNAALHAASQRR